MNHPGPQPQDSEAETPGQKQARLRRERREAKIKEGGSARLEKITKVSGRQNLPEPPSIAPTSPPSADPNEVDLSTHPSTTRTPQAINNSAQQPIEADIRTLLRGSGPQPGSNDSQLGEERDPMMNLLQQMMGGVPDAEGQGAGGDSNDSGLPPGLAAMLGAAGMGGGAQAPAREDKYGYLWRIVHAIFAFTLGIYITATSHAFTGDISRGGIEGIGHEGGKNVFWAFATAELVLQSSRFFLEKGGDRQIGGWMGMVGNVLPEPWKGWVRLAERHGGIWRTVVEDGMVVVFVVGFMAWWNGAVG